MSIQPINRQSLAYEPITNILDELKCSVTRNLLTNAVVLNCGHSFNLRVIESLFAHHARLCPLCRNPIEYVVEDRTISTLSNVIRMLALNAGIEETILKEMTSLTIPQQEKTNRVKALQTFLAEAKKSEIIQRIREEYRHSIKEAEKRGFQIGVKAAAKTSTNDLAKAREEGFKMGLLKALTEHKQIPSKPQKKSTTQSNNQRSFKLSSR